MSFINSQTQLYGVIGNPIKHSLSPVIHNTIYNQLNMNRAYISLQVKPEELQWALGFFKSNLKGFNVTIPHKEAIIPYLDEIDPVARIYGAVNTVCCQNGKLIGYNTDGYGFTMALESAGMSLAGKKVLILGAGGAARVVAYDLLMQGCRVTIANRHFEKARALKDSLAKLVGDVHLEAMALADVQETYEGIVNTTPLGMLSKEEELPVGEQVIQKASILYDLVYNPAQTKFLKLGQKYGCQTLNGLPMLFYQGVKAQEIWLGESLKKPVLEIAYQALFNASAKL